MKRILRTRAAEEDYRHIWRYIAMDNVKAANQILLAFDRELEILASYPDAGRRRLELRKGLRSIPVGQYLLFYRPIPDGIELLRVIHGARRVRRKFFRSE